MLACFRRQSRLLCTSVESAEEKGTWLSPGEGHHQDADGRGLGGEEHGLSVGTEGEALAEVVSPGNRDSRELKQGSCERYPLCAPRLGDFQDLEEQLV